MSTTSITDALDRLYRSRLPVLVAVTARRWGALGDARIEDAVHDVAIDVLRRSASWARVLDDTGHRGFERVFLRAVHCRLARTTRRDQDAGPEALAVVPAGQPDASTVVAARQELQRIGDLVEVAACRFGGGSPERLRGALFEKLVNGVDNSEAARRHATRREYVSRAVGWLLQQAA